MNKLKFKSIFISDAHLGSKGAQAEKLLDWSPKTSLEEGLKKTYEWYINSLNN